MKAIICEKLGLPEDLVLKELETPMPKAGEVRMRVHACGLNFPDTLIIQGKYQFKPPLPFSPCSDTAGVLTAIGERVTSVKVGDEILAFTPWGGLSQEMILKEDQLFPKLKEMSFPVAASFMMTYATSYHALKDRANLQTGEPLLVLGASGGVGITAIELGKLMGATVIAAASTDEKLALCTSKGADYVINYNTENLKDRVKALTGGKGADVIYAPVGGDYSEAALRATAWNGRFLVVGFAAGDIPRIPLNLPLLKGCAIVGVFAGAFMMREKKKSYENSRQLFQWFKEGSIKPYLHATYPLEEAPKAFREIMDRKAMGKIVINMLE